MADSVATPPDHGFPRRRWLARRGWVALAAPGLIYMTGIFVVGFVALFWASVKPAEGEPAFAVYRELLVRPAFWAAVERTLRTSVFTVFGCLVVALPIAYGIARARSAVRDLYLMLVIVPWLTGVVVRSFGWQVLLGNNGLINWVLLHAQVVDTPVRLVHNELGIVIGLIAVLSPFMILTALSAMATVPRSLEEASVLLGTSPIRMIWDIIIPLARKGIATGSILVFLMSNAVVVTPLMLGGLRSQTVATLMYRQLLELYNFREGAALAFILVVLVVPPTLIMTWWGGRGSRKGYRRRVDRRAAQK